MMKVGGYSLDLYCDNASESLPDYPVTEHRHVDKYGHLYSEFPKNYSGHTGVLCRLRARGDGWILGKRDRCPKCSGKVAIVRAAPPDICSES